MFTTGCASMILSRYMTTNAFDLQVFFRVSMALLDLSKEHLMSLDFDGTVE